MLSSGAHIPRPPCDQSRNMQLTSRSQTMIEQRLSSADSNVVSGEPLQSSVSVGGIAMRVGTGTSTATDFLGRKLQPIREMHSKTTGKLRVALGLRERGAVAVFNICNSPFLFLFGGSPRYLSGVTVGVRLDQRVVRRFGSRQRALGLPRRVARPICVRDRALNGRERRPQAPCKGGGACERGYSKPC